MQQPESNSLPGHQPKIMPPPLPEHMIQNIKATAPPRDKALALPKLRDLRSTPGRLQVAGGVVLFFIYMYGALYVAEASDDSSFNVIPGVVAVLGPPIALAGIIHITGARALGRGFVSGLLISLIFGVAKALL